MKITQIINEDLVIAQEEHAEEAACWLQGSIGRESESLLAIVENAFGIIERHFGVERAEVSSLTYRRFAEHMRTSLRYAMKEGMRPSAADGTLGALLRQHMPDCYECACEIRDELERRSGCPVPEDELLDLMLHVYKVVSNMSLSRKRA